VFTCFKSSRYDEEGNARAGHRCVCPD
jgi:hypothetical protein